MPRILNVVQASLVAIALTSCGRGAPDADVSAAAVDSVQAADSWHQPVHLTQETANKWEFPAGSACEFAISIDSSSVTNVKRFMNEAGERVRAIRQTVETNVATNLATGAVITGEIHYTLHVDFITGDQIWDGVSNQWRDATGKLVAQAAGRTWYAYDPQTDSLVPASSTPHDVPDWTEVVCPALADAPVL